MKAWTYKGITAATEKQIIDYMGKAASRSDGVADMYREWAYGAFNLWAEITKGEWREEDFEHLRKLACPD
ncbi:hypothetical protein [Brenneria tiliae]|uniref:Uncharacterized protein n=1 Tax=Brenneria tiliae TaxID=2914984 RepID=A0ABT0MRP8_9GAMM|nr:hypothetical protein [Brenneria tiliae]MCL2892503.1 hypothetical protein [Brenneria tiliae]